MAMVMNKAAPIEASKGNQPRFSLGNSIGMNASAPAGAKNFPVHSKMRNRIAAMVKATILSGR